MWQVAGMSTNPAMPSIGLVPRHDLARLLERTSRTFALAIPLLEEPLATQVGLAYLLFRVADELEDAPRWGRERRARALASFVEWIDGPSDSPEWMSLVENDPPTVHPGCLELLARGGDVLGATRSLPQPIATTILAHTRRTARGMAEFVATQDEHGGLVLSDVDDLRRYAYVVAGIVGEMLTDLFSHADAGVAAARVALDADARSFGEGLQLVNILKDAPSDAREGRVYLPPNVARSTIVELARSDLARATRYVRTLVDARAPRGVVAFCELPVCLAEATLDRLEAGAPKLSRDEVMAIVADVTSRDG